MNITEALIARFWPKVDIKGWDECWEWKACRHNQGYGFISHEGRPLKSHRVAWAINHGAIPEGLCILHKCDNPSCCNPAHLFLGTQIDNIRDCKTKGRIRTTPKFGESNGHAKLDGARVLEMREIRKITGDSYKKIADRFNVSTMTAFRAITGKLWSHL